MEKFADYMVKDVKNGECFRADHLLKGTKNYCCSPGTVRVFADSQSALIYIGDCRVGL